MLHVDGCHTMDPEHDSTHHEDLVVTPGGPRPREQVHAVEQGQVVFRGDDGLFSVISKYAEDTRLGGFTVAGDYVLTPGGVRHKSLVRHIEPGHVVDGGGGRLRKLQTVSQNVVVDFGPLAKRSAAGPLMPLNVSHPPRAVPAFGSGWIVYTGWTNNTGQPVSLFTTAWSVPPAPATQSGQTIFLFNGIQNSTMIYQPVLQWGTSAAGGGNYWAVASWYVDGQGGPAHYSSLVQVSPGDMLIGIMTKTGQVGTSFNYNCVFQGIPGTSLDVQNVEELTWCIETLEAYGITKCSDYPATDKTAMQSIDIQTGATPPGVVWQATNLITDCGQRAIVVSASTPNGEVDLYYR